MVGFTTTFVGASDLLKKLDKLPGEVTAIVKGEFLGAVNGTFSDSQTDVPVDKGDLKGSGKVVLNDHGNTWEYDVSYGDGSETSTTYMYDTNEGPVEARGYSWFTELGHMSRAGNPVPAQPYLGNNFYTRAEKLMVTLAGMFS